MIRRRTTFTPQTLKTTRSPEVLPFKLIKGQYVRVFSIFVVIPVVITIITLFPFLFFSQFESFSLLMLVGLAGVVVSLIVSRSTYKKLESFKLRGSLVSDLAMMLERTFMRVQSLIFPLFFLLLFASLILPRSGDDGGSLDVFSSLFPILGIFLPLIGTVIASMSFFNFVDDYNNKVYELVEIIPGEDLRESMKEWGNRIGYTDVKLRLGDLYPDDFCNITWSVDKNGTVLMVYDHISYSKASREQSLVYCLRELMRVKQAKLNRFYLISSLKNLYYILSFSVLGLLLQSVFDSEYYLLAIEEPLLPVAITCSLLFFIASVFFRSSTSVHELISQLEADRLTIDMMVTGGHELEKVLEALNAVLKLNPLLTTGTGYEQRKKSINNRYKPEIVEKSTGITWDDL